MVRKQYAVKQKPATREQNGAPIPISPSTNRSSLRVRSRRECQHHKVTTPNPFDALVTESMDILGEETSTQKLPIKVLGAYPIDDNE